MNEIFLKGDSNNYLMLAIDEEFRKFGKLVVEIKVGCYFCRGISWFTFGEIQEFLKKVSKMYDEMKGTAKLADSETNLDVVFSLNKRGFVVVNGRYKERFDQTNELIFELELAQSQLHDFIERLKAE
ncbi:WapI family immunity protein [Paenibacillus ferrarius]|uniref:WapI family immunity protein n=1 Tax=Paenibacillus ferrarius TaxID=1469647 RepID=UPI003D2AB3D7